MWSNFSDEDSRSSRCVLCENEAPWGGTGVSAAILYWIGICKIIQNVFWCRCCKPRLFTLQKSLAGAWRATNWSVIKVSSRYHQQYKLVKLAVFWQRYTTSCVRSQAFAVVETSAKGVSICLVSRWRLGDGKRCFRGSFLDSNLKAWKTWQWQIFGLHWCNVEVCLVFMYIYVLYLSQKETDWLGCIGGYTVILPLVYRDNDSLWWESPLTKQYNGML